MKKIILAAFFVLISRPVLGVSMNFGGHFRAEASHLSQGNLGTGTVNPNKSYLAGRALLNPNLVVDDHFSVKSQWSLLTSPTLTPDATSALGVGQGSWVFGDVNSAALVLSRAWLEWTSDFGVFSIGRMPVSWGYGLMWDAGNGIWDDFQTTLDRLEYRLHLGHVVGALAYSKPRKFTIAGSDNDAEFYSIYLQYDNPELEVEGGIKYEKQQRGTGQQGDLMGTSAVTATNPSANPYRLPVDHPNPYPLSVKTASPLSNNVVDLYLKKTVGYFTFGGEVAWLTGDATDYNGDGAKNSLNAFGLMLNTTYEYHKVRAFFDFLFASGDGNLNSDHLNGFVVLHRNRRPGLILGRELLGPYYSNHVGLGSLVVYGDPDTFSGVAYFRPGLRVDWSSSWSSGIEFLFAQKANAAAGEAKNLGFEIDAGTEYAVYKNFDLGVNLGYLFPGNGLRVPDGKGVFAFRSTAAVKF